MKILVTGGAGFIGTNLLNYLLQTYPNAELISFDISQPFFPVKGVRYMRCDVRSLTHLLETTKDVDTVFHLAAELGTHETFSNPDVTNSVNINGTVNILECAKKYDFSLFVASMPGVWYNPYSISKECAARYVIMYAKEFGVKAVALKWFSVYGLFQYINKYQKAVPYFISQALHNEPLLVYGDGNQEADFVHVEDAVRAADEAIRKKLFGEIIEFGTGKGVSVNELASMVVSLVQSKSPIHHVPLRRGEDKGAKIFADTQKMDTLLQYAPKINLTTGLQKTIEFYRKYPFFLY